MKISIEYKIRSTELVQNIELTREQFFEGDIAKYGATIKYILELERDLEKSDIEYTLLIITGSDGDKVERVTYFSDENELRYTKDFSNWELIVQQIQISKDCFIITRMERDSVFSDWKNISYSTILNPARQDEQLFKAHKGEYITLSF